MAWPIADPRWRWIHWPFVFATGLLFIWNVLGWLGVPVPGGRPFQPLVTLAILGAVFTQAIARVLSPASAARVRALLPFWIIPLAFGLAAR